MNTCGTCKWYQPHRDATTKRIRPTMPGQCTWEFPWPDIWPSAYDRSRWEVGPRKPTPSPKWMHDGERCPCWEAKDALKPEAVKQETLL